VAPALVAVPQPPTDEAPLSNWSQAPDNEAERKPAPIL